jgi:chromosome partitioning protein
MEHSTGSCTASKPHYFLLLAYQPTSSTGKYQLILPTTTTSLLTPPQLDSIARSIILAADLILIPVQPSPHDIWSASSVIELINEASAFKENLKTAFIVNRKITNTALGRDVFTALENYPFPCLTTPVCQRVAFAESAATGQSVLETAPQGSAAREIESITDEILEMIQT